MSKHFERTEPWRDVPQVPDELRNVSPKPVTKHEKVWRALSDNEEVYGDVPVLPEELREPGMLREAVRAAGVVEILARLRTELEERIGNEKLSAEQWWPACQELLAQHPDAKPYQEVVRQIVMSAVRKDADVGELWKKAQAAAGVSRKNQAAGLGSFADDKTAKELFRLNFRGPARGNVGAVRGVGATYFTVESQDMARIMGSPLYRGVAGIFNDIPYFVAVQTGRTRDLMDNTLKHESEHIQNEILREGRKAALVRFQLGSRDLPADIGKRLEAWRMNTTPVEENAKDELLAQFVSLEAGEAYAKRTAPEAPATVFQTDRFLNMLQKDMMGYYSRRFYSKLESAQKHLDPGRYQTLVKDGIAAYLKLRELYPYGEALFSPDRMARNVLEQFPLHRWPAAVRLLEMHHREKAAGA